MSAPAKEPAPWAVDIVVKSIATAFWTEDEVNVLARKIEAASPVAELTASLAVIEKLAIDYVIGADIYCESDEEITRVNANLAAARALIAEHSAK